MSILDGLDLRPAAAAPAAGDTETVRRIVKRLGGLEPGRARYRQSRLFGGTEDFLVTREFRAIASDQQCRHLLTCLFELSAADESISSAEEGVVSQIARELGIAHDELVAARRKYSAQRSVLRRRHSTG
jgi:hypothetical protein